MHVYGTLKDVRTHIYIFNRFMLLISRRPPLFSIPPGFFVIRGVFLAVVHKCEFLNSMTSLILIIIPCIILYKLLIKNLLKV